MKTGLLESKWVELLDHYREARHGNQYSTSFFVVREEAENALRIAKEFVERMNKIIS